MMRAGTERLGEQLWGVFLSEAPAALRELALRPIDPIDLREWIARLRTHVSPAFLPFATFNGAPWALHLVPGVALRESPIVQIDIGSLSPRFICGGISQLVRGVFLMTAGYSKNDPDGFRHSLAKLSTAITGSCPIQDHLWEIFHSAGPFLPSWWAYHADSDTRRAWAEADVEHPFARLEPVDADDPAIARAQLQAFVGRERLVAPEILAALLEAEAASGESLSADLANRVLEAEAWLGGELVITANWRNPDRGVAEWGTALKLASQSREFRETSPFGMLSDALDLYSGRDPGGPPRLIDVAQELKQLGDPAKALSQLRNSALVALHAAGRYDSGLCTAIADLCDTIEPEGPAGALARAYGQVGLHDA